MKDLKTRLGINKDKLISSLLTGFAVPFVLLICASLSVYFANYKELSFTLKNFLPIYLFVSLFLFVAISLLLLLSKNTFRNIIFSLCAFSVVTAFVQTIVTNLTFKGLPGDGNAPAPDKISVLLNLAIWFLSMCLFIFFGVIWKKRSIAQQIMCFLLILVSVMQIFSILPSAIEYIHNSGEDAQNKAYLSEKNLTELSDKDNIVVIILDRFDRDFFVELMEESPEHLKGLDGFTYYDDNVATFARTYPAVVSMLTGINSDFSLTREEYLQKAYTESPFFHDLKNNNYKINLYTTYYHAYEDGAVFGGLVDNVVENGSYEISVPKTFLRRTAELFMYFQSPQILKSKSISAGAFNTIMNLNGEYPGYTMSDSYDPQIYQKLLNEKLYTQSEKNTFTFLHLRGCHLPYAMDADCNKVELNSVPVLEQTKGSFRIINEYISQMKTLGIYENSTIIITGDHSSLISDTEEYTDENLTALLVKEKGDSGTPLKVSSAPVSQDNFLPAIIKSAGIATNHDYGVPYSDVPEDSKAPRYHYFQVQTGIRKQDVNVTYEITGDGRDFSNWKITNREIIGDVYK